MKKINLKQRVFVLFVGLLVLSAKVHYAQEYQSHLNSEYGRAMTKAGTEKILLLDLFVPDGKGPFPIIAWIHGGAWRGGSKSPNPNSPQLRQVGRRASRRASGHVRQRP